MDVPILDISYKWNKNIFPFCLWLLSDFICVVSNIHQYFIPCKGYVASLVAQLVKNLPEYKRPGLGRSLGEGNGNPLQYSCLENPMDRGAWQATVHGVARVRHDLVTKPLNGCVIFHCMCINAVCLFICWWTFWAISTFWLLWIVLLWVWVLMYLFEYLFSVFGNIHSWIAGWYGNSMFNFLRSHQIIFHSGWVIY